MRLLAGATAVIVLCGLALAAGLANYVSHPSRGEVHMPPVASLPDLPVPSGPTAPPFVPAASAPTSQPVAAAAQAPTAKQTADPKKGQPTPHGRPPK